MVDHVGEGAVQAGRWPAEPAPILFLLSGALLGLATLATVASCWIAAPTLLNLGLSIGAYVTASGLAAWANHRQKLIASDLLLALASLSFAASIWQMGQVFDVAEDLLGGISAAMLAAVLIGFIGRSSFSIAVSSVIYLFFTYKYEIIHDKFYLNSNNYFLIFIFLFDIDKSLKFKFKSNFEDNRFWFKWQVLLILNVVFFNLSILDGNFIFILNGYLITQEYLTIKTITFFVLMLIFSIPNKSEYFRIPIGWFAIGSLMYMTLFVTQPLEHGALLFNRISWFGLSAAILYLSHKKRHPIGIGIAYSGFIGLYCAVIFDLGLGYSGSVAGLLIAGLLIFGLGLRKSKWIKSKIVPQ